MFQVTNAQNGKYEKKCHLPKKVKWEKWKKKDIVVAFSIKYVDIMP